MRNEKGGVVDFTTASPKKKSKINNYIINNSIINKNIYKYPNYKIIFSVKIIQKWWRKKILLYNNYLNKIKLIQNIFRNYINRKNKQNNKNINNKKNNNIKEKNENNENNKNKENNINNKYKLFSITLLKKIIQLKLINKFNYLIQKMIYIKTYKEKQNLIKLKNNYLIHSIIEYYKKCRNKNNLFIFQKLRFHINNHSKYSKYIKIIKLKNIFIPGQKYVKHKLYDIDRNINNDYYLTYKNKLYSKDNSIILNNINKDLKESKNVRFNIYPKSNILNKNKINNVIKRKNKNNEECKKYSNKIILNERYKKYFSKIKNNPNLIAKFILKKIYFNIWHNNVIKKSKSNRRIDRLNKNFGKNKHLFLRNIMINIIEKIKKEANRRTLIKAFRDINKLKYPILFYSLLKIQKYSIVKYNVMNAYAKLIQKNYRYFKDKKSKINQYI